ncbi:hypothetical protein E2P81_ATG04181 [Venturia nashicola]|uniref:Alpha/beta-hydrolase n=1 Tax=Venturia nashicola TaxID=86259 RepID=A0A4Z1P7G9_9PEZI|nr:hypothetical protein E6O75_ATG04282 [Venturia nashicola]TLD37369.1 hypothetical protein E2P81_ATG04181 [Venturia nashicola]
MRSYDFLILTATSVLAKPQAPAANIPASGDNGQMGGIFGMGVSTTPPAWASGLSSALSSFGGSSGSSKGVSSGGGSSGLSGMFGSLTSGIDANAIIEKLVPAGPEYPKGKMTLADFYDPGSGPYPAHFITEPSLGNGNHTIYKPKNPPPSNVKMPVLIWGNGGCTFSGTPYAPFLTEVASHGYICIANGPPGGSPPSLDLPKDLNGVLPGPNGEKLYSKESASASFAKIKDMTDAIDWVVAGNAAKYGNVDIDNFITAGSSCGGLEAYSAAYHNPRVKLIGVYNSGVIDPRKKYLLKELKAAVAYFQGGPQDPGYTNSEQDYVQLPEGLPAFKASLDSGHMGTFFTKRAGKYGTASVGLFEWFFRGDQKGKAMWTDAGSEGSMVKEKWNVTHKNFN